MPHIIHEEAIEMDDHYGRETFKRQTYHTKKPSGSQELVSNEAVSRSINEDDKHSRSEYFHRSLNSSYEHSERSHGHSYNSQPNVTRQQSR